MTMTTSMLLRSFLPRRPLHFIGATTRFVLPSVPRLTYSTDRTDDFLESLKNNPYYAKYANKLIQMEKGSPEEFHDRVNKTRRHIASKMDRKSAQSDQSKPIQTNRKSLHEIMKLDMIGDKTSEEISNLWHEYNEEKNFITAVIPWKTYAVMMQRSKDYPVFLFPLPRENGYEFFVSHFQEQDCYFTQLINFQTYKENAPPSFVLQHYAELAESKDVVLVRGEIDKNALNGAEARCLMQQLQLYYADSEGGNKWSLLRSFKHEPDSFRYMDLVKEIGPAVATGSLNQNQRPESQPSS